MAANMDNKAFDDNDIYTGLWINRAHDPISGATLTLNRRSGAFLIAFLALFVGVAGKAFWKIARFLLHSYFSSTAHPDTIYHQRQAILRNAKGAEDAVEDVLHAMLAWRKKAQKSSSRFSPVLLLAFVIVSGFAAAGVFSSRVTAGDSNEVLLSGRACKTNLSTSFGQEAADYLQYRQRRSLEYLELALECYQGGQVSQPQRCQTYTKPSLPYTRDFNAKCPFKGNICQKESGNIELDSGFQDGNSALGINAEPAFNWRIRRRCAPLVTEGYSELFTDPQDPSAMSMVYNYARSRTNESARTPVYQASVNGSQDTVNLMTIWQTELPDYHTKSTFTSPTTRDNFIPIPELDLADAQTSLHFLGSKGIAYREKSEDPWFAASSPFDAPASLGLPNGTTLYASTEPATVMGCTLEIWYCNPKLPEDSRCISPYVLGPDINDQLADMWPNSGDLAAVVGFISALNTFTGQPDTFYRYPSLPSLLSRFTLVGAVQMDAFPSNKWQQEMEYSYQASLASIQSGMVEAARRGASWPNSTICTKPESCQKFCYAQRIRSPQFYSFSVIGIFIIVAAGIFLFISSAFLETIAAAILRIRGHAHTYAQLEWENNSILQVQRLAHEELGLGTWSRNWHIPITYDGENLGIFDTSDPHHVRLRRHVLDNEPSLTNLHTTDYSKGFDSPRESPYDDSQKTYNPFGTKYHGVLSNERGERITEYRSSSRLLSHEKFTPSLMPPSTKYTKVDMNDKE